jgi:hypothetical protein
MLVSRGLHANVLKCRLACPRVHCRRFGPRGCTILCAEPPEIRNEILNFHADGVANGAYPRHDLFICATEGRRIGKRPVQLLRTEVLPALNSSNTSWVFFPDISAPSSLSAKTTKGLSFPCSRPALSASKISPPNFRKYASAIWLRAELCTQRQRTLTIGVSLNHNRQEMLGFREPAATILFPLDRIGSLG